MHAYSDLASERRRADTTIPGVTLAKEEHGSIQTERLSVASEEGAKEMEVPCGIISPPPSLPPGS